MSAQPPTYNVVGAGVFGASTALHLVRRYPHARIRLIDRQAAPCRLAASWDWNKVVRADYTDTFSMKLALKAKHVWQCDPLFKQFYHQDGMFWVSDTSLAHTVVDLYKKLGAEEEYRLVGVEEAVKEFDGVFEDADYRDVAEILVNKSSGWAEAKEALAATVKAAVDAGVEYVETDVTTLRFSQEFGRCQGVLSRSGESFPATHTILCTGAGTAVLLANSAPNHEPLHVGNRMIAAAICTGLSNLSAEDRERFANVPVCCQEVLPGRGGSLPPTPRGELKFWRDVPFKNTIAHTSGQLISVPDYEQEPSLQMKEEVEAVKKAIFGKKAEHLALEQYRICWDAITPDENFIISPHSQCEGLYIATAGSFHGWKFLPIIGEYVVKMLNKELDTDVAAAWAWDRDADPNPDGDMWPRREMKDLLPQDAMTSDPAKSRCTIL